MNIVCDVCALRTAVVKFRRQRADGTQYVCAKCDPTAKRDTPEQP